MRGWTGIGSHGTGCMGGLLDELLDERWFGTCLETTAGTGDGCRFRPRRIRQSMDMQYKMLSGPASLRALPRRTNTEHEESQHQATHAPSTTTARSTTFADDLPSFRPGTCYGAKRFGQGWLESSYSSMRSSGSYHVPLRGLCFGGDLQIDGNNGYWEARRLGPIPQPLVQSIRPFNGIS